MYVTKNQVCCKNNLIIVLLTIYNFYAIFLDNRQNHLPNSCIFNKCLLVGRFRRDVQQSSTAPLKIQHDVPSDVPFYLSCPVDSHHATYRWEHGDKRSPCQQTQSECLLLIPSMKDDMYGNYKCVSHELDYTKTVNEYDLFPKRAFNDAVKLRALDWLMAAFVTSAFYLCSL